MSFSLFTFKKYLEYQWKAVNAHGLHSPFLYQLYHEAVKGSDKQTEEKVEEIRNTVFSSDLSFSYRDPKSGQTITEKVGPWARRVCSSKSFSLFLIRLTNFLKANTILETGTAAGINACSLALSSAQNIITIEGSDEIIEKAEQTIRDFGNDKVTLTHGTVRDRFPDSLVKHQPDLIFLDADHRQETIDFYLEAIGKMKVQPTCIVVHDIYWSRDMYQSWKAIIDNPDYTLTMDIFQAGLIFPQYPMEKQHFQIRF